MRPAGSGRESLSLSCVVKRMCYEPQILDGSMMRYLAFLLVGVQLCTSLFGEEQTPHSNQRGDSPGATLEQIVQATRAVMDLSDPAWQREHYRTLFNNMKPDDLGALQTHQEDAIAVRAAWQAVVFSVPDPGLADSLRPVRHQLDWFLGFLEGRLRVQVPPWWAEALLDSRADRRFVYPGRFQKPTCHEAGVGGLRASTGTALKEEDATVVLTVGNESVPIPKELLAKTHSNAERREFAVLMTPSRCYIVVHGQVGYPYDLACVDRLSGKALWRSKVRGTWSGFSNGYHEMRVTITEQDSRVVVFGCALTGVYVEVFQSADGLPVSRFSSSY